MPKTEDQLNTSLKFLRTRLTEVIGSSLGQYELMAGTVVKSTVPAIWIEPPSLPVSYRMKVDSGIEAVINREGAMMTLSRVGGQQLNQEYIVKLTQYKLTQSFRTVIERILAIKDWEIYSPCVVTPGLETAVGYAYPQAIIKIETREFQEVI